VPPRRIVSGLDSARVGMMLAVLQRRAGLAIGKRDVFAATVGGVRLTEPSIDLAVGLAVASAVADLTVPPDLVAIGEVGLAGEIRRVTGIQRRIVEAERMGFRRAIIPAGSALRADTSRSRPDRSNRGASSRRSGQPSHLRLAVSPPPADWTLPGSQLVITEVADMQSAIAASFGQR
jgi:predicted ATP-dependent serine protease